MPTKKLLFTSFIAPRTRYSEHYNPMVPAFTKITPYSPNSPYSASKASGNQFVRTFHETYNIGGNSVLVNLQFVHGIYDILNALQLLTKGYLQISSSL